MNDTDNSSIIDEYAILYMDIKYIFLSLFNMGYYICKFTIDFIFIISKFFTSTCIQLNNPIVS